MIMSHFTNLNCDPYVYGIIYELLGTIITNDYLFEATLIYRFLFKLFIFSPMVLPSFHYLPDEVYGFMK